MSCAICGRGACERYMHSIDEQERFDRATEFDGNVRAIMDAIGSRDSEIEDLRRQVAELYPKAGLFDELVDAARWSLLLCAEIGAKGTNAEATARNAVNKAINLGLIEAQEAA